MRFAEQFWLWLVPLLPLVWLLLRSGDSRARRRLRRLLGPGAAGQVEGVQPRLRGWSRFLWLAGLFWLLLALARPQWGASEVTVTQRGSDIVVALDISNSMLAEDVLPNRLERAKTELGAFLRRLEDSRVGLVYFAGSAFVQCPLTLDYGTAEIFLKMAGPDMMSAQGTNIGAALRTARALLVKGREGYEGGTFQAILLVTDGEDLEGEWEGETRALQKEGIRVIPVGVGDEGGGLIPIEDARGRPAGFMKDEQGNVVTTHLDLVSLEKLAAVGGGSTFRLGVDGLAGDRLFRELQRLGRRDLEERRISAYQERFLWPLLLAAACFALRMLLTPRQAGRRRATAGASGAMAALWLTLMLHMAVPPAAAGLLREGAQEAEAGRRAYRERRYEEARAAFESASARAPNDPLISLALGETLFQLQRYEEARAEFERARNLTADAELLAEALYNQGTAALADGDLAAAIEALQQSLALGPDQQDALYNLEAAMRRQQQQQQEAGEDEQQDQQGHEQQQDRQNQQNQQQPQDGQNQQDQQDQQDQQNRGQQEQEQQRQNQDQQQEPRQQETEQQQEQEQQRDQRRPEPDTQRDSSPEPQEARADSLSREQALQILNALDRDEEELKRSVQQRLRGGEPRSGKKW